ncbi:hypothetical protein, partial [Roseibium sp.]|uniref:hypothetical protein n=1 Tax=Roseibium sp. TaxID=1936156 RepID=UPI00329A34EB
MAAAARARARVIKMKTSDVEDAIAAGTLQPLELEEQDDDEHLTEPASLTHDDSTLSDDEEADLAAELANVEAEERAAVQPSRVRPRRATVDTEGHDQAVERLLEETNTKLEDAEGTRRRKGFAHLKAAVAATVADRKFLGGRSQTKKDDEPYREDLAAAAAPLVKSDAVQKDNQEQAPLMLVSEQRVDAPSPKRGQMAAVGGNVSPSMSNDIEIASPVETGPATYTLANAERILSDSTSFEDFAKELGVEELPDLLEAAAAYVAYVQGRPQFSRPHLMSILAKAEQAESYSREDELRSFGQLLREG